MEFQERAKELATAWVQFLSGANRWTKRLPHGVLILQLEQLFSVSAMGSAASTGQDVGRQVTATVCIGAAVLLPRNASLPVFHHFVLFLKKKHIPRFPAGTAVAAVFGPRAIARLPRRRHGHPRRRPHLRRAVHLRLRARRQRALGSQSGGAPSEALCSVLSE